MPIRKRKSFPILATLLLLVVVPTAGGGSMWFVAPFFCAVVLSALYVLAERRRHFIVGVCILAPAMLLMVLDLWLQSRVAGIASGLLGAVALGFLLWVLTRRLLLQKHVTWDTLSTAISGYLLLGMFWSFVLSAVWMFDHSAFTGIQTIGERPHERPGGMFYFAFVTLTTLGYGDMAPVSAGARAVALATAVTGQLYISITLAVVVGKMVAGHQTTIDRD